MVDTKSSLEFLRVAFQPDDWVALLVKSSSVHRVAQRVVPISVAMSPTVQAWLSRENEFSAANVYVGVNALRPRTVSRRRSAVGTIRHVFLDADDEGGAVLRAIERRADLPTPSYVLHSSPNRIHIFWRVTEFAIDTVEALQRRLARELHTDSAAISCSQLTRLPGFDNRKRPMPWRITMEYRRPESLYSPADFPRPLVSDDRQRLTRRPKQGTNAPPHMLERARRYLAAVPPAISGQHGDLHTFRVCCRLVRGFALDEADALDLLSPWNARCQPPWSDRDLADKVRHARRYGREPIGGLCESADIESCNCTHEVVSKYSF